MKQFNGSLDGLRINFFNIVQSPQIYNKWAHCSIDLMYKHRVKEFDLLKEELNYKESMKNYSTILEIICEIFSQSYYKNHTNIIK